MSVREKYHRDPAYRTLVDMMVSHILKADYTPSEMREAAILASIIYEENFVLKRIHLNKQLKEVSDALNVIENFID